MAQAKSVFSAQDIEDNKIMAAISYVWILCLVPLLLKRDSKFAQAHAKQGLVLFIVEVVGSVVFWIPLLGWLLWVLVVVSAVAALIKALQGEFWSIPGVDLIIKKLNL